MPKTQLILKGKPVALSCSEGGNFLSKQFYYASFLRYLLKKVSKINETEEAKRKKRNETKEAKRTKRNETFKANNSLFS